jgi:hypothetical protein
VRRKIWPVLACVGLAMSILGGFGLIGALGRGQGGFETGLGGEVAMVDPGGPADRAGLVAGDRIVAVDGHRLDSPWRSPSRELRAVGDTQRLRVARGSTERTIDVNWEPLTSSQQTDLFVQSGVAIAFVTCGLAACILASGPPALLLALLGLSYGLVGLPGLGAGLPGDAFHFLRHHASLLTVTLLCHFLVIFPEPKRIRGRPVDARLLYVPYAGCLALGVIQWFAYPALFAAYALSMTVVDLLYMLLVLAALFHTWIRTPGDVRRRSGFHCVPLGIALALGPILIVHLIELAIPGFSMPGRPLLPLFGAAIPLGLAAGVVAGTRRLRQEVAPATENAGLRAG